MFLSNQLVINENQVINYITESLELSFFKEDLEIIQKALYSENMSLVLTEEDNSKLNQMIEKFKKQAELAKVELDEAKTNKKRVNGILITSTIVLGVSIIALAASASAVSAGITAGTLSVATIVIHFLSSLGTLYGVNSIIFTGIDKVFLKKYTKNAEKALEKLQSKENLTEKDSKRIEKQIRKLRKLNASIETRTISNIKPYNLDEKK